MIEYFLDIKNQLEQANLEKPIGATEDEINSVQKTIGFELPAAYKGYLSLMGKDYKGVMIGTDCFIGDVTENTEYLPQLLKENSVEFDLAKNYLAFFCHQGYMVGWFNLPKESENPKCYFYSEGSTKKPIEFSSFVEFMSKDIRGNIKLRIEERMQKKWWQFWR